jgi:hypothetical protein
MRRSAAAALALAAAALAPAPGEAQLWEVKGTAGVREEFNTNWLLTPLPHSDNFITSFFGTLEANRQTETSRLALAGTLRPVVVAGPGGTSYVDGSLALEGVRAYERDQLAASLGYLRDSTLRTELAQTGIVLSQTQRNLYTFVPSWTHQLGEATRVRLAYNFTASRYDETVQGLFDYDNQTASVTLTRVLSPRIDVFATGSGSVYQTIPDVNRTVSYTAGVGVAGRFSETLSGTLSVNYYRNDVRTRQAFTICPAPVQLCLAGIVQPIPVTAETERTGSGYAFDGDLAKRFTERTTGTIVGGKSLQPSGSGALFVVQRLGLNLSHELTETLSASAYVQYVDSRLAGAESASAGQSRLYGAGAGFSWRATRTWRIEGGVRGTRVEYPSTTTSVESLAVFVSAAYVWDGVPLFRD